MSKNYNQYYNRNANYNKQYNQPKAEEPVKEEVQEPAVEVTEEVVEVEEVAPAVETVVVSAEELINGPVVVTEAPAAPVTIVGVVSDCTSLRVRKAANAEAEILGTIELGSEVAIDEAGSTSDFYKVCTAAGLEGFCMKKFITIK